MAIQPLPHHLNNLTSVPEVRKRELLDIKKGISTFWAACNPHVHDVDERHRLDLPTMGSNKHTRHSAT